MKFTNKFYFLICFFVSFSLFSLEAQDLTQYPPLLKKGVAYRAQLNGVSDYTTLFINEEIRQRLKHARPKQLKINIPADDHKTFDLNLIRFNVATDDFILRTSDGDTLDYDRGVYYKGTIEGEEGFATLAISGDHIMGMISTVKDGNFSFGQMKDSEQYVIFNSNSFQRNIGFECQTPDPVELEVDLHEISSQTRSLSDCVKVYIEGDNELRINKGGVSQASDYIMDVFSVIAVIYDNESINTEISEIMIWTSPDGYSTSSAGFALDQFEVNNPNPNGDLAHLFALGGNNLGGIAWLDVLCSNSNYAYSNISSFYQDFPSYSWTINVVAHEMGHNLGSQHTHSCSWPGGAIDNCYQTEGSCSPGPPPVNGGTIMSYCHLTGAGINLNNGFGPLPGQKIRDKVSGAFCLSACNGGVVAPVADFTFVQTDQCATSDVQFFDNSLNGATSWSWTFDGGIPSSSTDQNPIISYVDPGLYDVTLEVTNGGGSDETTQFEVIEVIIEPIVFFNFIVDVNEVSFNNVSTGADDYFWSFGDGENSSEESPTHTYENDGVYVVSLLGSNDCGAPTITKTITISTMPQASFSVGNTGGCAEFVVQFANNSSDNVDDYTWSFPGGDPTVSVEESPTVSYVDEGSYDVQLIVTNLQGSDTLTFVEYIDVTSFPEASISATVNGGSVTMMATTYSGTSYDWDFGDGMGSTDQNTTHEYASEGDYTIQLITTNSYCSDTSTADISILFTPIVVFTADVTEDCAELTVNFTNQTAGSGNTYLWTFDGGTPSTSTDENPTVMYDMPGVYNVTLSATNSSGTTILEETEYITVFDVPVVDMNYTNTDLNVSFNNLTSNATAYTWNFGDGNTSNEEHPTNNYTEEGVYTVVLLAEYPCGTEERSFELNLYTIPVASYSAAITSGCAPFTVEFIDESSDNTTSWSWSFVGGSPSTSTEQNPTVVYEVAGDYDVELIATNPAGNNTFTNETYITVEPLTEAGYGWNVVGKDVIFSDGSINATSYSWDFGDGTTSLDDNPSHSYEDFGVYIVTLIVNGPCGEDTLSQEVTIQADAIEDELFFGLEIFPNPVSDILTIKLKGNDRRLEIELYNIYGVKISLNNRIHMVSKNEYQLSMKNIITGGYILKLNSNNAQRVEKIVVY